MNVRTSTSHPLRIDWVAMPAPWRVGITIAPGKKGIATEGFRWERDLEADLDVVANEGAHTLVCLVERHELEALGIAGLLAAARRCGLETVHHPIRDVSVPEPAEARRLVGELLQRRDGRIVVHCVGGLGRSGVVVGCLLRALGVSVDETFRRLHAARGKRCPETAEQRVFIEVFSMDA